MHWIDRANHEFKTTKRVHLEIHVCLNSPGSSFLKTHFLIATVEVVVQVQYVPLISLLYCRIGKGNDYLPTR